MNPSFENYKYCPNGSNQNADEAYLAIHWNQYDSLKFGTCLPELCLTCATPYKMSVPYNTYPGDFQYARTGENMMHVWCYDSNTSYFYQRDYLHGYLTSNLENGHQYCITYYLNLKNTTGIAVKYFGLYLDNGTIDTVVPCNNFTVTPQIDNTSGMLNDTLNWMKIQGVYTSNGTETNITLGNFKTDANSAAVLTYSTVPITDGSYYFVDDVSIIPIDLPAYAGRDTTIAHGDSAYIGRPSEIGLDDDCIWYLLGNTTAIDTIAGMWVKPNTNGTHSYVVEQNICGTVTYDTVNINVIPTGIQQFTEYSKQLFIYPNPSTGDIFISAGNVADKQWKIEIDDVTGRIVLQDTYIVNNGLVKITTQFITGVYFVKVTMADGTIKQQKIVITK